MIRFADGLINFVNDLVNTRSPASTNAFVNQSISPDQMRAIYATGLGNKIVRIKTTYALKKTVQFEKDLDREFYEKILERKFREAAQWAVAFGRGILVLHRRGDDLSRPISGVMDRAGTLISVFSGDMVTVAQVDLDLQSPTYYRPILYNVRGVTVHRSRVVDVIHIKPPEQTAAHYMYGGIGEFNLIHEQILNDGIVQRASPRVLEKSASIFYKIRGFRSKMAAKQSADMVSYFRILENLRSVYGAGLLDSEDEIEVVNQALTNLAETDNITLRRLAMVTGIPITVLVGENARGMNSTGDNERQIFQEMLESLQQDTLLPPLQRLVSLFGGGDVSFVENQGETPLVRANYDATILDNAAKLAAMGEDHRAYLAAKDIIKLDEAERLFADSVWDEPE